MSFLTLDHVSHYYFSNKDYVKTLDNISFSAKDGEFIAILGPSGCGKSTLLSIIAGDIRQTTGRVLLNQEPLSKSELGIGYMLQRDYLFPWKTIIDNVLIGPKIRKSLTAETREKAVQLLEKVGLPNVTEHYPNELSDGMRQRVALVRTLITDPKMVLLDEPFTALDNQSKLKLEGLVSQLLRNDNKTALLATHDIGEAIAMSDRIIVIDANPGSILKIFEVPIELRNEVPFLARRHSKYQLLFDKVWGELDKSETTPSTAKVVANKNGP